MNIEEYISSGIIEAYVIGITTDVESAQVEAYAQQYPEIRMAIEEARVTLEYFATSHAQTPPAEVKESIWTAVNEQSTIPSTQKIIVPSHSVPQSRSRALTWLAAASVILMLGTLVWNINLQKKNQSLEQTLTSIQEKQKDLEETISERNTLLAGYHTFVSMIADSNVSTVEMKGVGGHLNMQAMVLWDKTSKDVYLSVNNLPKPPQGKQYQLWAIVDGKPVDMGVFDVALPLQKLKATPSAEMFAVTLEQEGGSPVPTLEQMYVAGKI